MEESMKVREKRSGKNTEAREGQTTRQSGRGKRSEKGRVRAGKQV